MRAPEIKRKLLRIAGGGFPVYGDTGAGGAEASIPLGEKGSVLDQSRYPARVDYTPFENADPVDL